MTRASHEYFRQFTYEPQREDGAKPIEVVWAKRRRDVDPRGSTINVGDSWSILADAVPVPASPGVCDLTAECFSYGSDGQVAPLRGLLKGRTHDEARLEGECIVGTGSAAGVVDGSYPAYALLEAGEPVGLEVEFLKPEQGYCETDEVDY